MHSEMMQFVLLLTGKCLESKNPMNIFTMRRFYASIHNRNIHCVYLITLGRYNAYIYNGKLQCKYSQWEDTI